MSPSPLVDVTTRRHLDRIRHRLAPVDADPMTRGPVDETHDTPGNGHQA
jgi:hypothetical protein